MDDCIEGFERWNGNFCTSFGLTDGQASRNLGRAFAGEVALRKGGGRSDVAGGRFVEEESARPAYAMHFAYGDEFGGLSRTLSGRTPAALRLMQGGGLIRIRLRTVLGPRFPR